MDGLWQKEETKQRNKELQLVEKCNGRASSLCSLRLQFALVRVWSESWRSTLLIDFSSFFFFLFSFDIFFFFFFFFCSDNFIAAMARTTVLRHGVCFNVNHELEKRTDLSNESAGQFSA